MKLYTELTEKTDPKLVTELSGKKDTKLFYQTLSQMEKDENRHIKMIRNLLVK